MLHCSFRNEQRGHELLVLTCRTFRSCKGPGPRLLCSQPDACGICIGPYSHSRSYHISLGLVHLELCCSRPTHDFPGQGVRMVQFTYWSRFQDSGSCFIISHLTLDLHPVASSLLPFFTVAFRQLAPPFTSVTTLTCAHNFTITTIVQHHGPSITRR